MRLRHGYNRPRRSVRRLAWDTGDWPGAGTSTASGILEHQPVTDPVRYSITPPSAARTTRSG